MLAAWQGHVTVPMFSDLEVLVNTQNTAFGRHGSTLLVCLLAGCAAPQAPSSAFSAASSGLVAHDEAPAVLPANDSPVDDFVAYALRHRPELRARLEQWRAASAEARAVDELPPLEVMYGYYFRRVETRVGPQRHRVRVQQGIPWPGKAQRAREARRIAADVEGVQFDGELVDIRWEVVDAYWRLWTVAQQLEWQRQHYEIARSLSDSVRGRIEVGSASLADVSQSELLVSRTADAVDRSGQQWQRTQFDFARAVGFTGSDAVAVAPANPRLRLPAESDDELVDAAQQHPRIRVWAARRDATTADTATVRAKRYPDLGVGVEWMETGIAHDPSMHDSGKDAVVGTFGLQVPLWNGELRGAEEVLAAKSAAFEASEDAAKREADASVRKATSDLRETARRVRLYERTLVPQAEAALGSVRGAYEVGQSSIAALLIAQNELLQLRLQLVAMLGEHEQQWAMLERLVARPVPAQEVP